MGQVVELVPGVEPHGRIQAGGPGAEHRRAGLPAGDLVGQQQLEERGVAHFPLPGQGEPFGQVSLSPPSFSVRKIRVRSAPIGSTGPDAAVFVVVVVEVIEWSPVLLRRRSRRRG